MTITTKAENHAARFERDYNRMHDAAPGAARHRSDLKPCTGCGTPIDRWSDAKQCFGCNHYDYLENLAERHYAQRQVRQIDSNTTANALANAGVPMAPLALTHTRPVA